MLYASLLFNGLLAVLIVRLWLKNRDGRADSERTAREFELMLQAQHAEQRTELLQVHALLAEAKAELRNHLEQQQREPSRIILTDREMTAA